MATWGDPYPVGPGIDWRSALVIVAVIFGLFLEALWVG